MRRSSPSALATLLLAATALHLDAQPSDGFAPLFDGTLGEATIENAGTFTIAGSVLHAEGPNGWLRFPTLARDFRLALELRFTTDNGDSGVFVRALPDGAFARGWPNRSYQVQLLNPLAGGSVPTLGGLFRHGMPPGETTHDTAAVRAAFTGTGSWQRLEIEVRGTELVVRLNDREITRAAGIADVEGYIGIQSETSAVEFRRIDIQLLARR